MQKLFFVSIAAFLSTPLLSANDGASPEVSAFVSKIQPFLKSYCIKCHGPENSKGEMALHTLSELSSGRDIEQWELILEMLKRREMPPQDEPQPSQADQQTIITWIETGLREYIAKEEVSPAPTTRRLTNFEYQNTMRDLLGFELKLIKNLPKDPVKPYRFNNTSEFMSIGPEQMDRYKENARRAMASAIVDPGTPEIHQTRREWEPRHSH